MWKHLLWLFALAPILLSPAARAESLDDATIRKIYTDAAQAIHDADKSRRLMNERFDDNFIMHSEIVRAVGNNPPEKSSEDKNKAQAIHDVVNGIMQTNVEDYDNRVISIQYSGNNAQALVDDQTSSSGTISVPQKDGQYTLVRYAARETCTDTLALVDTTVKIMKSDCSDQIALGP